MITGKHLAGEWYHGDERKTDFINRNYFDTTDYTRDRNAMGPGIYFTRLKYQASGYAGDSGYVYTATVNLDPKRTLEDNTKPNPILLRKFVDMCPDKEMLYNYSEDLSAAPEIAVEMNMDSKNMLEALMGLYNDLYQRDAVFFAKAMTEIGYDAFYHKVNPKYEPDAIHLIVYNPKIINIIKEEHKEKVKESSKLKYLKSYKQLFENEIGSDPGVVTFDFDGVLHSNVIPGTIHPDPRKENIPNMGMIDKLKDESLNNIIYIVTARNPNIGSTNKTVDEFVKEFNLPVKGVICTSMAPKLPYLLKLNSKRHYDDNKEMEKELQNTNIEFILVDPSK